MKHLKTVFGIIIAIYVVAFISDKIGLSFTTSLVVAGILGILGYFALVKATTPGSIYCAKCDQLLGNSDKYESPCPRCRSNRTTDSANRRLN
jgi:Zn finger protein HypA/HybF involved in hydrogenase expression